MSYKNARAFHVILVGMEPFRHPFLRAVLRAADANKRKQLLQLANADQINAVSELVLNVLKNPHTPTSRYTIDRLRPYKRMLRQLTKPRSSIKRRRHLLMTQTGAGFWNELRLCQRRCCRI